MVADIGSDLVTATDAQSGRIGSRAFTVAEVNEPLAAESV